MELIENAEVDPFWVDPAYPHSGRPVAHGEGNRWLAVKMGFNWRLIGVPDGWPESNYDHGWCFRSELALLASVSVWEPGVQDEPLGWHKRATPVLRRAPRREEDPQYNRERCVHGTYVDTAFCEHAQVCTSFPGVIGPGGGR